MRDQPGRRALWCHGARRFGTRTREDGAAARLCRLAIRAAAELSVGNKMLNDTSTEEDIRRRSLGAGGERRDAW